MLEGAPEKIDFQLFGAQSSLRLRKGCEASPISSPDIFADSIECRLPRNPHQSRLRRDRRGRPLRNLDRSRGLRDLQR